MRILFIILLCASASLRLIAQCPFDPYDPDPAPVAVVGATTNVLDFPGNGAQTTNEPITSSGTSWTIAVFVKPTESGGAGDAYGTILTDAAGTQGLFWRSDQDRFVMYIGADRAMDGTCANDIWTHICVVGNGTDVRLYTNAILSETHGSLSATLTLLSHTGTHLGVGALGERLKARVAELAVIDDDATDAEVLDLFQGDISPSDIGTILGYWKHNDVADGVTASDGTAIVSTGAGPNKAAYGSPIGRTDAYR